MPKNRDRAPERDATIDKLREKLTAVQKKLLSNRALSAEDKTRLDAEAQELAEQIVKAKNITSAKK